MTDSGLQGRRFALPVIAVLLLCLIVAGPAGGQAQCGVVQSIRFPVDSGQFRLVQDYATRSTRHHGRYHTGEDWYGGRGTSRGQPVQAIANGRVTYAAPTGWGRDGGVVIIEHVFPDDSVAYSVYGHMMETEGIVFPAPLTCVAEGDIIGAVGDVRPAPHLHFEIMASNPGSPGPGYSWNDPFAEGWRDPSKFVLNWQAWLLDAHRWHVDIADETGPVTPVELADHSLIYFDRGRVGRITPDGRILWRAVLNAPGVGVIPDGDQAAVVFADGTVQAIDREGTLGPTWSAGAADSAPLLWNGLLLLHDGDTLAAFDPAERALRWRLVGVPPITGWHGTSALLGLVTSAGDLLVVSASGELLDQARLRDEAGLASGAGGQLLVYTRGGLWNVGLDGTWTPALDDAPPRGHAGAVTRAGDGRLFLFDGQALQARAPDGAIQWQAAAPGIEGRSTLALYGDVLLLISTDGHVLAVQASSGALCGAARVYGDGKARAWHSVGDDGVLRVGIADQFLGLDWRRLLGACA